MSHYAYHFYYFESHVCSPICKYSDRYIVPYRVCIERFIYTRILLLKSSTSTYTHTHTERERLRRNTVPFWGINIAGIQRIVFALFYNELCNHPASFHVGTWQT